MFGVTVDMDWGPMVRLNKYLKTNSYIGGHSPTQEDISVLHRIPLYLPMGLPHVIRWNCHMLSFTGQQLLKFPTPEDSDLKFQDFAVREEEMEFVKEEPTQAGNMIDLLDIKNPSNQNSDQECKREVKADASDMESKLCLEEHFLIKHLNESNLVACLSDTEGLKGSNCDHESHPHITAQYLGKWKFKCPKCNYTSNQRANLNSHLIRHSSIEPLKCSKCDYLTNDKYNFKSHSQRHSNVKVLKCSKCEYSTTERNEFDCHLLAHIAINRFKCAECDYRTHRKGDLAVHLLCHMDIKPFKCSHCNYATNDKSTLRVHFTKHSNIKPFKCSKCEFATKDKQSLKGHLHRHTNGKRFKCSECDYSYAGCDLKAHLLQTHSDIKKFKCTECVYSTKFVACLVRHLKVHFRRHK